MTEPNDYRSIEAFLSRVFMILARASGVRVYLAGAAMLPSQRSGYGNGGITRSDAHAWAAGVQGRLQRELSAEAFAALVIPYASAGEYTLLAVQQAQAVARDTGMAKLAAERVVQHFHRRYIEEAANTARVPLERAIQDACGVSRASARDLRDLAMRALERYRLDGQNKVLEHYGDQIGGL